jgi:hypothetical protein
MDTATTCGIVSKLGMTHTGGQTAEGSSGCWENSQGLMNRLGPPRVERLGTVVYMGCRLPSTNPFD